MLCDEASIYSSVPTCLCIHVIQRISCKVFNLCDIIMVRVSAGCIHYCMSTNRTIIGPNDQKPCTEINIGTVEMPVIRKNMRK